MNRTRRPIAPAKTRRGEVSWLRRLQRQNRAQLVFAVFGLLVVCSLIAASLGTFALDLLVEDDPDPEEAAASFDDELIEEQRAKIERDPNDVESMRVLAELLAYDGSFDESFSLYERALELDPSNGRVRLSFALQLTRGGKSPDAELQYLKLIEANPNDYEAHYYLAELYRFWDPARTAEAVDHYVRVLQITTPEDAYLAEQAAQQLAAMGYATPGATGSPVPSTSPVTPVATTSEDVP